MDDSLPIITWELSVTMSDGTKHTREALASPLNGTVALDMFVRYIMQSSDYLPVFMTATAVPLFTPAVKSSKKKAK